jgi:uncharacterized protein (DUF2237 family)
MALQISLRWVEAYQADVAPCVVLESTHENTLQMIRIEHLKAYAVK